MVHKEELPSLKAGVSHQIQRQGEIQQAGEGEGLTEWQHFLMEERDTVSEKSHGVDAQLQEGLVGSV